MKKAISFLVCITLLFSFVNYVRADDTLYLNNEASTVFSQIVSPYGKRVYQEAFRKIIEQVMIQLKEYGTANLEKVYWYINDQYDLFYIRPVARVNYNGQVIDFEHTYCCRINSNTEVSILDDLPVNISEKDMELVIPYSSQDCYETALTYLNNQMWRDPSSLTVYSCLTAYGYGAGLYSYYFDYSAKNGFGGNNRGVFVIHVDGATNKVLSSSNY